MIALRTDCLVFTLADGLGTPWSSEAIPAHLLGEAADSMDPDFLCHATTAVLHYFKSELGQDTVTARDFTRAMQKVLSGLNGEMSSNTQVRSESRSAELDLAQLAGESAGGIELLFYPRLREEIRTRLQNGAQALRLRGLRPCVKELTRAKHWNSRCGRLADQIVSFLRQCLYVEPRRGECVLMVD